MRRAIRPLVTITPPPQQVVLERDVEVAVRDGTVLRVNVFRPEVPGRYPVLLCAHPYGKDALPRPARRGRGYRVPFQLRMIPQSRPFSVSAWTSWEAPDPATWVPRGYVVVNCDLRGWGHSDGIGDLLSAQEADDAHDLVEWAAAQEWSNGKVGMTGVSYLAITQWAAASTRPPHLAAICPWEGFTDVYRDFARTGGVREDGFIVLWTNLLRRQRRSPVRFRREQKTRPTFDDWWVARTRPIERIDLPVLVCGSFSDHNLHSRGSFEGFRRVASEHRWLYTHRGPKWSTYYSQEAVAFQTMFFDHFLRGDDNGLLEIPRVRVEIREARDTVSEVRREDAWPPSGTDWRPLHLDAATGRLGTAAPPDGSEVTFDLRRGAARFVWSFANDTDVVGPMWLRLHLALAGGRDAAIFAAVHKCRDGRRVGFEGSYGFDDDPVTRGWLKVSHRRVDPERSLPWRPFHPHDREELVPDGEVVPLDIELPASATRFHAGDELELEIRGRYGAGRNPLTGQFPAAYERSPRGRATLHCGAEYDAALYLPHR